jgi:hypothetical protein
VLELELGLGPEFGSGPVRELEHVLAHVLELGLELELEMDSEMDLEVELGKELVGMSLKVLRGVEAVECFVSASVTQAMLCVFGVT